MEKKDIIRALERIDTEAYLTIETPEQYRMVIVGGSGLILLDVLSRATQDIDALEASPEIRHLLADYDTNLRVSAYSDYFPYNFEDRLVRLPIGGKKVKFFTCSLEDIVIAKLYSPREKDFEDITSEEVLNQLNWTKLRNLALGEDEAKASALSEHRYQEFLDSYLEYKRRYGPNARIDIQRLPDEVRERAVVFGLDEHDDPGGRSR